MNRRRYVCLRRTYRPAPTASKTPSLTVELTAASSAKQKKRKHSENENKRNENREQRRADTEQDNMADYWKSNEKKYCDFCKCWLSDNKMSMSLHENGRRHKDNVSKRISEINKKTAKDAKIQQRLDREMNTMEKKAMAAYLKDIENNADLTSQLINEKISETRRSIYPPIAPSQAQQPESSTSKTTKWQEARSDDGHVYYWNTDTNDVSWEPPAEGYVSLRELQKPENKARLNKKPPNIGKKGKGFKKFNKQMPPPKRIEEPPNYQVPLTFGPLPRSGNPYGSWKKVETEKEVDLQLPEQRSKPEAPTISVPKEREFKEKQIVTFQDNDEETVEIGFKKRKIGNNKRNVRQRLDDD